MIEVPATRRLHQVGDQVPRPVELQAPLNVPARGPSSVRRPERLRLGWYGPGAGPADGPVRQRITPPGPVAVHHARDLRLGRVRVQEDVHSPQVTVEKPGTTGAVIQPVTVTFDDGAEPGDVAGRKRPAGQVGLAVRQQLEQRL